MFGSEEAGSRWLEGCDARRMTFIEGLGWIRRWFPSNVGLLKALCYQTLQSDASFERSGRMN